MRSYENNDHWMVRDEDPDHLYEPDNDGCYLCGWVDDRGVDKSDLIWSPALKAWLCMECD